MSASRNHVLEELRYALNGSHMHDAYAQAAVRPHGVDLHFLATDSCDLASRNLCLLAGDYPLIPPPARSGFRPPALKGRMLRCHEIGLLHYTRYDRSADNARNEVAGLWPIRCSRASSPLPYPTSQRFSSFYLPFLRPLLHVWLAIILCIFWIYIFPRLTLN